MLRKVLATALAALLFSSWLPSTASASHTGYHGFKNDGYWFVEYDLPGTPPEPETTDGLIIINATYLGVIHITRMSLPQIMVEYEQRNTAGNNVESADVLIDQLEYEYATGQPVVTDIIVEGNIVGFQVRQEFNMPLYRYVQKYDFYRNGEFYPLLEIYGPGLPYYWGSKYHAFWRIDLDVNSSFWNDSFDFYSIQNWQLAWAEHDYHDDKVYEYGRHEWQNRDSTGKGFISRPWVSSNVWPTYRATTWALRYELGEGGLDSGQQNFLDFPGHNWDNDEGVQNTDLVNWFVASGHKLYTDSVVRFLGVQFIPVGLP
ncbi:MAG: hypothetical protein HY671_10725 [Chloroflexi bacterium]|nr:hypothetical protein [Chloroflexota bacterium]